MTIQRAIVFPQDPRRWRFVAADGREQTGFATALQAGQAAERAGYSPHIYTGIANAEQAVRALRERTNDDEDL